MGSADFAALTTNGRFSCCNAADDFNGSDAACTSVRARALPDWAQSRHAAVQRIKFEPRPEGSRSRKAESLSFSAGWLDDRTFGSGKQPSDELVRNDGTEPILSNAARCMDDPKPLKPAVQDVWEPVAAFANDIF